MLKLYLNKQLARGVFVTDYGSDAAMYMNKFKGIRCAHITDYYTADMCRKVNWYLQQKKINLLIA